MRVAVKKIEGVDSIEVSLNRGVATISLAPDNRVTIEQVREAIRSNGFTPKAAEVRMRGRVIEQNGKLALSVAGQNRVYLLIDDAEAAGVAARIRGDALGKVVVLDGTVAETTRRDGPIESIRVRNFAIVPGP